LRSVVGQLEGRGCGVSRMVVRISVNIVFP
jgi:hypothetical protein